MSQKKEDSGIDIKAIDSFLVIIQKDSSRNASSNDSNLNEAEEYSKFLEREIIIEVPAAEIEPLLAQKQDSKMITSLILDHRRNQILSNIQRCQQIKKRYQNLLKGSPSSPRGRKTASTGKIPTQPNKKKQQVRNLDYSSSVRAIDDKIIQKVIPKQSKQKQPQLGGFPQLRIQPFLLTIYSRHTCFNLYLLKLISKGPRNQLFLVQELNSKLLFSLKMFKKTLFMPKDIIKLTKEMKLQQFFSHPNLIKLYHILNDNHFIYALYEPCMNYDLATKLKQNGPLTEKEVRSVVRQIAAALEYMQKSDFLHLKLRLENIYLQEDVIKVAALDQSVYLPIMRNQRLSSQQMKNLGSNETLNLYDTKIDIWDIGILTYQLLFDKLPIFIQNHNSQSHYSLGVHFPQDINCSLLLKQFIEGCLQQNPYKRFTLKQMNEHEFLRGGDSYRWTMM